MRALVTGGAGFIGSNVALELEKKGHDVIVIDREASGKEKNLEGFKGKIIEADILDKDIDDLNEKFDVIFHEASLTDTTFSDDREMIRQNVEGFKRILDSAIKMNAKLVYASSASVYGNTPAPMKESQEPEPLNAYAASKLEMDKIAAAYFEKIHIVGLRYFNVFGPHEGFKEKSSSMILQLAKKMINGKKPRLFKHGEQKRDHIYVLDAVKATIMAADAKKSGIYNVGTGTATNFDELVKILNSVIGTSFDTEYFDNPYAKTYQSNTQADTKNAEEFLGFSAGHGLKQAISEYVEYIKVNKNE